MPTVAIMLNVRKHSLCEHAVGRFACAHFPCIHGCQADR